jgi:hypothetical protein
METSEELDAAPLGLESRDVLERRVRALTAPSFRRSQSQSAGEKWF